MEERDQELLDQHAQYVYDWVTTYDDSFATNVTLQGFTDKIRRDANYRKELYDWIKREEERQRQKAQKEGKEWYDVGAGGYEKFEERFYPLDEGFKKKMQELESTIQEDTTVLGSENTFWDLSDVDADYYKPRDENYANTFNEEGFEDWWNTNPDVLAWKENYNATYNKEPSLDRPIAGVPEWYDMRSAYELGITPQLINGEYSWSTSSPTGEVISPYEGVDWRKQFYQDTGTSPPEDMSRAEAYATYYDTKTGRYTLIDPQFRDLIDVRYAEESGQYANMSQEDRAKYGVQNTNDIAKAYYSYFKTDPTTLGLNTQEMIEALNKQEEAEWKQLTDFENMTWIFNQQEEVAAPLLEQMFREYGFEVGQRKIGKDYIEIIAANGESITLSVDRDEGGSWLEGETWIMGNTASSAQNAKTAIRFFNQHRQTRVPGEQKFQDAQNAQFYKDWKKHQREVSKFKEDLADYNAKNYIVSNTPRSKRGAQEYIDLKKSLVPLQYKIEGQQEKLLAQDANLLSIQEQLKLRPIVSEEWVQGEGAFMDFFNDMYQMYQVGQTKGAMMDEGANIFFKGNEISEGELRDLIGNWNAIKASGTTDELKAYNKEVAECGGDLGCAARALYKYPSVATAVFAESAGTYLNATTLELGFDTFMATVAAATTAGGITGGPVGAAVGFAGGLPAGALAAIGVMSGSIETTMTYMELLSEYTGGDMSDKAIREVLNDPEKLKSMKNEALGRGLIIGGFDTLTGGLAGTVTKTFVKKPLLATTLGLGVESVGGATGEFVAQLAQGDGINASDVLLEGVAGISSAPITIGMELLGGSVNDIDSDNEGSAMKDFFEGDMSGTGPSLLLPGVYKINGAVTTPRQMVDFVTTATDKQVAGASLSISGNPKLKKYAQDKRNRAIERYEVDRDIDPLIKNPEDRNVLIDLELERKKLEGNNTYTAKVRLRQIDGEIKNIVDKYTSKPEGRTDIEGFFDEESKQKRDRDSRLDPLEQVNQEDMESIPKGDKIAPPTQPTKSRLVVGEEAPVDINPEGEGTLGIIVVPRNKYGNADVQMKRKNVVKGKSVGDKIYLVEETIKPGERVSYTPDPVARKRTIRTAQNAFKAIKKLAPKVNLIMYETHKEYVANGNSKFTRGSYSPVANSISISLEKVSPTTATHEVVHAMLGNLFPDIAGKELKTKQLVEAIIRIVTKRNEKLKSQLKKSSSEKAGNIQTEINENESFLKDLREHVDKYEGKGTGVKNEEFLAEAIALIATRYPKLPKEAKSKVRQFIEWVLKSLGLEKLIDKIYKNASDNVIADALNNMAGKMRTGQELTQQDVEIMDLTPEQEKRRTEVRAAEADELNRYRNKIEEMKREKGGVENMTEDELVILEGLELELAALEKGEGVPARELEVEGVETKKETPTFKEPESVIEDTTTTPDEVDDSKAEEGKVVVDEESDVAVVDGVQLEFYHNTKDAAGVNVKPIERGKGEATQLYKGAYHPKPDNLTFFTPSRKKFSTSGYQGQQGAQKKYKVKLDIKNPYFVKQNKVWSDAEVFELKEKGYDAIITHVDNLTDIYPNREQEMNIIPIDKSIIEVLGEDIPPRNRFESSEQRMDKETQAESPDERNSEIIEIIQKARENNFSDSEITDYLVRVKKFNPSEVKKALEINIDDVTLLPKSFADIKGGAEAGVRLFKRVNKYKDSLVAKNKQAKKKLTQEQITDKVIQYLEQQPEFIREGSKKELSPLQAKMQIELQSTLGMRPTRDMGKVLRESKKFLKGVEKGTKTLQSFKQDLRNFMRKALPETTYTKPEVLKMVSKIEKATRSSIKNIMNEVINFTNEKVATSLEKDINAKLNAKNEVKLSGRNKATKIDADAIEQIKMIKEERVSKIATPKEVYEKNALLAAEYDGLAKEINPTDEQIRRMAILEIAMKLNNATLMNDTDINKVQELSDVNNSLEEIIVGGRQRLEDEVQAAREEYERQLSIAWEDITKEKVDASTQEGKNQIARTTNYLVSKEEIKATQNVLKRIMRGISNNIAEIFISHEALDGLMDKISLMPGELFGGKLKELVYERVNEGTRLFKARKMAIEKLIMDELKKIYGKNYAKQMVKNRKTVYNKIYKDADAVKKAQKKYNADKTIENKDALRRVEIENNIEGVTYASQEQLYYLYNQYKDPANHPTFKRMWGDNYEKIAEQVENALTPAITRFADWQVNELFPMLYPHYNKTYRKIYRTNMPQNEHYAGTLYREGIVPEPLDLLSGKNIYNTTVGASSTIARVENTNPIKSMMGTDVLMTYITDMEYFAAMAEPIRDIDKLFTNDYVKKAIESIHGKKTYSLIKDSIQRLANRGVRTNLSNSIINGFNNVFIFSRLGFNPTIMIKQLTSMFTYANDIGINNWVKYGFKNMPQLKKLWKEVQSNSPYLQDRRYNGIMRHIESYSEKQMQSFIPNRTKSWMINFLMWSTKTGDMGAIMLGGLPNYSYYKAQYKKKNPNATEQEVINYAIKKFESDTKRTQQSVDLQDKDVFQTSDPLVRAMNMFLTTPKQYLRKEIQATRNLWRKFKAADRKAGKGTLWENIRSFIMYHVFMPVLFQFAVMGFKIDEEEDWWDISRAAIIGNFNALFILGDLIQGAGDFFTGKPWAGEDTGSLGVFNIAREMFQTARSFVTAKSKDTKEKYLKKLILESLTITGLPSYQIDKFIKNYSKVLTGDVDNFHELVLRLFNYSEYQIDNKKKKRRRKSSGRSSRGGGFDVDFDVNFDFDVGSLTEDLMIDFDF